MNEVTYRFLETILAMLIGYGAGKIVEATYKVSKKEEKRKNVQKQ